jgi:hypothetical protein
MSKTDWLADLQDGDKVILAQDGYNPYRRVTSVRLTPTQIIVEDTPRRFDRQTGNIKGKWDYHAPYLLPYTPEAVLKIRLTRTTADMIAALKKLSPETLDLPHAAKLHGLLTQGLAALADCGLYPREEVDKR